MNSSILTNASALTALQSLQMTEQALNQTQTQISTGLAVSSASDNASYWSIATQMTSDNGVLGAVTSSLGETSSILDVANAALNSVISTINNIKNDLADAANPGADLTSINGDLQQQGKALLDAVNGASFNGTNLLNGSAAATLNFVSGYQQTADGAPLDTIAVNTQALYSGGTAQTTTVEAPAITAATTVATIQGLTDNTASPPPPTARTRSSTAPGTNPDQVSVTSVDINGVTTKTTYTALDASGNATTVGDAVSFGVQVATTSPAGSGLLTQGTSDLTNLNVTTANVDQTMTNVNAALAAVTAYASALGSTQSRVNSQSTFLGNLSNALTTGVSLARRCQHEPGFDAPAGPADAAAARHSVAVDRQPEHPAHSQTVRRHKKAPRDHHGRALARGRFAPAAAGGASCARACRDRPSLDWSMTNPAAPKPIHVVLKRDQKFLVNGALIRASNPVHIDLYRSDVLLTPNQILECEEATTPLERLYYFAQQMLIEPEKRADWCRDFYKLSISAPLAARAGELKPVVSLILHSDVQKAMTKLRRMIRAERKPSPPG